MTALAVQLPADAAASASAKPDPLATKATSPTGKGYHPASRSCAEPRYAGEMGCLSLVRDDVWVPRAKMPRDADPAGFGPADLRSAYDLPSTTNGEGRTVAIVDAFDNPNAEAELASCRTQFGLSACSTDNGCFKKVDQRGGTAYPVYDDGWAGEISLDVQMVSAVCPSCHILLVESDENSIRNLGSRP
ncbi:hypothetical protein AB0M68_36860 [Streptomyces sp. NPDC051453]|uniref:hypothetical protein n=1 Tax=Streptomyces sp. NPDC051453 TaxID=3154941 RepID=UPI00343E7540